MRREIGGDLSGGVCSDLKSLMARDDWYRNIDWNQEIAGHFEEKLQRSRNKNQYLRIQALTLIPKHPQIALELLDRYFLLDESHDRALAYQARAEAHLSLGRIEDAIIAYEATLLQEAAKPNVGTWVSIEFPYLVAVRGLTPYFQRALEILGSRTSGLVFPVMRFKFHAARALILAAQGDSTVAQREAKLALDAAAEKRSEFERHPTLGLVSNADADAVSRLRELCDAS
jgi:tetratricopeptide (TPR) repeat protein